MCSESMAACLLSSLSPAPTFLKQKAKETIDTVLRSQANERLVWAKEIRLKIVRKQTCELNVYCKQGGGTHRRAKPTDAVHIPFPAIVT